MSALTHPAMVMTGPSKAVCHECADIKGLSEFPVTENGRYSTICAPCHEKRKLLRKQQKIKDNKTKRFEEFARQINRRDMGLPRLGELAVGMLRQFGGVESFCMEWFRNIEAAEPGSKTRLDQYKAISQLVKHANEQLTPTALDDLSDEELVAEATKFMEAVKPTLYLEEDDYEMESPMEPDISHDGP